MNPEAQITGERIAMDVAARAAAADVLTSKVHFFSWWHVCMIVLFAAGNAWLGSHVSTTMFVVGDVAQLGLLLAVNAHVECLKLRRRIDAALVLVRQSDPR